MSPEKQLQQDLEEALEPVPTREWSMEDIQAFHAYIKVLDEAGRFTLVSRYVNDRALGEDPDRLLNRMAGRVHKVVQGSERGC